MDPVLNLSENSGRRVVPHLYPLLFSCAFATFLLFANLRDAKAQEAIFNRSREKAFISVAGEWKEYTNKLYKELVSSSFFRSRYEVVEAPTGADKGAVIKVSFKHEKKQWSVDEIECEFKDYRSGTSRPERYMHSSEDIIERWNSIFPFEARVQSKSGDIVGIDLGTKFGIVRDERFDVFTGNDRTGLIQVTNVYDDFSEAKVIRGDATIGATVREKIYLQGAGFSLQYLWTFPAKADINHEFEVNTMTTTKEIKEARLYRLDCNLYRYDEWTFTIGVGLMTVEDAFKPFLVYLGAAKNIEVFPEVVQLYMGGDLGIGGGMSQKYTDKPNSTPGETSISLLFPLDGFLGLRVSISSGFSLFGDAGYRSVMILGKPTKDAKHTEEIPDNQLQYNNIYIGGFVPRVGMSLGF